MMTEKTPEIKAVIFDMDGLMFDTERIYLRAFAAAEEALGAKNAMEMSKKTMATTHDEAIEIINAYYEDPSMGRRMVDFIDAHVAHIFATEPTPVKPGLFALLDYLESRHIPMGVASSSPMKHIRHHLECAHISRYFSAIVSEEMVCRGKPAPDLFLKCSKALKVLPENCLVLEDSLNGLLAADRAGMIPVMIPDLVEPTPEIMGLLYAKRTSLDQVIDLFNGEYVEITHE